MNGVHIHLLINHIPVLGSIFALCIFVSGLIWRSNHLKHAALITVIICSLFGIGAFLSGEEAEHAVEDIYGINKEALEEHEEAGELSMWALVITAVVSLFTLIGYIKNKKYSKLLLWGCLVLLIISVLMMIHTGKEGGLIRHTEILRTNL